ncbi:MAG: hypothetical protein M3512_16345 [Bacteroidota bacterium]|nr:hypothetical protein [Bacteroidota bacterium]
MLILLLVVGCSSPSLTNKDEKTSSSPKFSSSGYMVLGNIFVAELGKNIYQKNETESNDIEEDQKEKQNDIE